MAQDQNVRFVRINGRVVPIKQKGPGGTPPPKAMARSGGKNKPSLEGTRLATDKERSQLRKGFGFFGAMAGGVAGAAAGGAVGAGARFAGSKVKKLGVLAKASGGKGALIGAAAGAVGLGAAFASSVGPDTRVRDKKWEAEQRKKGKRVAL